MFCNKCGKELSDGAKFCPKCGTPVQPITGEEHVNEEQVDAALQEMNGGAGAVSRGDFHKKCKVLFITVAVIVAAVVVVLLIVVLGGKGKPDGEQDESAEETVAEEDAVQADGSGAGGVPADESGAVMLSLSFREVIYKEGLPDARVFLTDGYDNPNGEIAAEFTTQSDGTVQTEVAAGEYTLCWEAEGYYSGHENLTVSGAEMNVVKHMLPVLTDQKAYVMVEWDSDSDLDLCVFNAQTQQYINIMGAVDDTGDFLYFDNSGEDGYELIYLNDYTAGVYTVYVRDGASLLQETGSAMESEGLTVSIYTADGLLYQEKADVAETAALWSPVYLYQGEAIELGEYIYDLTNYAWAICDKSDESYVKNEEAMEVYAAFLRGEYATEDGRYLTDLLPEYEGNHLWNGYVDEITYAYLDLGADNVQELLVTLVGIDIYARDDDSTMEYILQYDGTALKICYEYETWARSHTSVSYYGVVNSGGSSGAASHGYDQTVLDADGNAIEIFTCDAEGESTGYMEPFYSDGIDVREELENHGLPNLGLSSYRIADNCYLVFEDEMNKGGISFEDAEAFLENLGYQFYTYAQIKEIIADYIRQLGIEGLVNDETQPVMQTLDTQYYAEYAEPETLSLTEEEIDVLLLVWDALYGEEFYTSRNIKEEVENSLYDYSFFYNVFGDLEDERVGDYLYWYFDVNTLNQICGSLGIAYDFTGVYENRNYGDGSFEAGVYYDYDTDQIVVYNSGGLPESNDQYEICKEDGYWRLKVGSFTSDGSEGYYSSLWLRPVNNELGYVIYKYTSDYEK